MKMKDGRIRMRHKAEHEVDLDTGALLAVTVQGADKDDPTTLYETLIEATGQIAKVCESCGEITPEGTTELAADKEYHSNTVLWDMRDTGIRTYMSEAKGPRRDWKRREKKEQKALYANRRRSRGDRYKSLMRKQGCPRLFYRPSRRTHW